MTNNQSKKDKFIIDKTSIPGDPYLLIERITKEKLHGDSYNYGKILRMGTEAEEVLKNTIPKIKKRTIVIWRYSESIYKKYHIVHPDRLLMVYK